jgi:hypothetical protein
MTATYDACGGEPPRLAKAVDEVRSNTCGGTFCWTAITRLLNCTNCQLKAADSAA